MNMNKRFDKQVAIVTGAANGLGKGIALRLAEEGCQVVLLDINKEQLANTVSEFSHRGLLVEGQQLDVSDEPSVVDVIDAVADRYGKIDILVHSAAIVGPTSISTSVYPTPDFDRLYQVNLRSAFLLAKHTIPVMEAGKYGRILLLASMAGKEGNPYMIGYSAMKAGIIGMVKALGKEYAEKGITINGLAPAVIKTPMNDDTDARQLDYMIGKIPMKRLGTVEEVAAISAWIVSKEASFTTGFTFDVSGGRATY
ncbi:SDR family NAD(P)-dependent oxidoreductase [Parapedobacter sp. 2B3]|uniref:SDR family NAD(P)-dependent oxidoreductase n=1 Tax=Parapedobacter sp. 2B3 TaxID=3342381 RepID=UPI0035B616AB